jgi:hypothetical protein
MKLAGPSMRKFEQSIQKMSIQDLKRDFHWFTGQTKMRGRQNNSQRDMKRICLVTTGGTIASQRDEKTGHVSAGGAELRAALHDPLPSIDLEIDEFCNIGSFAFDLPLAFKLAQGINERLDEPDCDGRHHPQPLPRSSSAASSSSSRLAAREVGSSPSTAAMAEARICSRPAPSSPATCPVRRRASSFPFSSAWLGMPTGVRAEVESLDG